MRDSRWNSPSEKADEKLETGSFWKAEWDEGKQAPFEAIARYPVWLNCVRTRCLPKDPSLCITQTNCFLSYIMHYPSAWLWSVLDSSKYVSPTPYCEQSEDMSQTNVVLGASLTSRNERAATENVSQSWSFGFRYYSIHYVLSKFVVFS